jgi:hypothetical protein
VVECFTCGQCAPPQAGGREHAEPYRKKSTARISEVPAGADASAASSGSADTAQGTGSKDPSKHQLADATGSGGMGGAEGAAAPSHAPGAVSKLSSPIFQGRSCCATLCAPECPAQAMLHPFLAVLFHFALRLHTTVTRRVVQDAAAGSEAAADEMPPRAMMSSEEPKDAAGAEAAHSQADSIAWGEGKPPAATGWWPHSLPACFYAACQ